MNYLLKLTKILAYLIINLKNFNHIFKHFSYFLIDIVGMQNQNGTENMPLLCSLSAKTGTKWDKKEHASLAAKFIQLKTLYKFDEHFHAFFLIVFMSLLSSFAHFCPFPFKVYWDMMTCKIDGAEINFDEFKEWLLVYSNRLRALLRASRRKYRVRIFCVLN